MMNLNYMLHSGKNPKWLYWTKSFVRRLVPRAYWELRRDSLIDGARKRPDWDYICNRVDYYCQLPADKVIPLPEDAPTIPQACHMGKRVYRTDTAWCTRWFPRRLRMFMVPGDVTEVPAAPSFLKSRPIRRAEGPDNTNSVLLKLNAVRHFIFVDDQIPFADKRNEAVFRGKVKDKPMRQRFFRQMFGKPFCNLGDTSNHTTDPQEWQRGKMTISEQLQYKFVLALEGNDVASNLKWVMSSNSIAVSPRMHYETWFMEGRLEPDYHYIEVKDDFSDLEEKLHYYATHPAEAQAIIDHAHDYVRQFCDARREQIINLLVCNRYFRQTGQTC